MLFDERQRKEIEFCKMYAKDFKHGTDGHNAKLIIAKMAIFLERLEAEMTKKNLEVGISLPDIEY